MVRLPENVDTDAVDLFKMRNFVDFYWMSEITNWCISKWFGLGIEDLGITSFLPLNRPSVGGYSLLVVLLTCGCEAIGKTLVVT